MFEGESKLSGELQDRIQFSIDLTAESTEKEKKEFSCVIDVQFGGRSTFFRETIVTFVVFCSLSIILC